jgi:predicted RNA-binding Zn ribbon-like protein
MVSTDRANKQTRGRGRTTEYPRVLGGVLCLDFANTIDGRLSDNPEEFIDEYEDLVGWAFHVGVVEDREREGLVNKARSPGSEGAALYERGLQLRQAVYCAFRAMARSEAPDSRDLSRVGHEYAAGLGWARLVRRDANWAWSWNSNDEMSHPLWAVAASAVELLSHGDVSRVKECPGAHDCGWLYYDASRNRTRRWCSMEGCGSRVKMRRHYARRNRTRRP